MPSFRLTSGLLSTAGMVAIIYRNKAVVDAEAPCEPTKPSSGLVLSKSLSKCRESCQALMCEKGLPGLFVAVHKDGRLLWEEGLGFSDVENGLCASPNSVLRIASISKSLTSFLAGKFIDEGKLHLEEKVSDYIPDYPYPNISVKQLLSHTSGIRHYEKKKTTKEAKDTETAKLALDKETTEEKKESEVKEFHLNKRFKSVTESLDLFKNDELLHEPGEKYSYTTHGFTLLSVILEEAEKRHINNKHSNDSESKANKVRFAVLMKRMFRDLGLDNTYLDENDPIIYNRARYYVRDKDHALKNSPYVDNSYKWAGGGFLSTVRDLCKFGDIALYSFQYPDGYLHQSTTKKLWSGAVKTYPEVSNGEYGLGWAITPEHEVGPLCRRDVFTVDHTGGAIGASSILFIQPSGRAGESKEGETKDVKGVVVAIITNMEGIRLKDLAKEIAHRFE